MKEIKAIMQPAMLARVIGALQALPDLPGVTVSEVKGFGKSRAANAEHQTVEDDIEYSKKVKLEIVVADDRVDEVLKSICANAHRGRPGDGKIFVLPVNASTTIAAGVTTRRAAMTPKISKMSTMAPYSTTYARGADLVKNGHPYKAK